MGYHADHHQAVSDPFGHGDNAPCLGLMMNLDSGFTFPWRDGGVALLRREVYPDVGEWTYCGIAVAGQITVKNFPGMGHEADQAYEYTAVQFLGNGMVSVMCEPVRLDFDAGGNLITPRLPNAPINLTVKAIAGGKFSISWSYNPFGQGGPPTDFQVFTGVDRDNVDYDTPLTDSVTGLDYVAATGQGGGYAFTTAAYGDLTPHVFGVRARSSAPVAEQNTYVTDVIKARAATPTAAPAPEKVHVQPYSAVGV